MKSGKLVSKKGKREGACEREREKENRSGLTRESDPTRHFDPDGSRDSGHLTGRAWYRYEAWKPAVINLPSSPSKTNQKAGD